MLLGRVYFIAERDEGAVAALKIGYVGPGEDVWARRSTLQTGNPRKLTLEADFEGARKEEAFLHFFFRAFRIRGEWFEPEARLSSFILACQGRKTLDLSGLAPCTWTMGTNGERARVTRQVCLHCPRCERPETEVQAELRREIEARVAARTPG